MAFYRDVWIPVVLRDWTGDARFALRVMWRQRGFAAAAVITLGLAIGISNTVYTVVNAMIRQLLIESLLLALIAGVVGFLLSVAGLKTFAYAVEGINFPYWYRDRWTMDHRVFGFMCGMCLTTAFLFGVVPALHLARRDVQSALNQETRTAAGGSHVWANILRMVEVSVALMLLAGAGLMMRSFLAEYRSDMTADAANVLTASLRPPPAKAATGEQRISLYRRIEERLRSNPMLMAVTFASTPPYIGAPMYEIAPDADRPTADDPMRRASFVVADLAAVAMCAVIVPALRASRIDPNIALRHE